MLTLRSLETICLVIACGNLLVSAQPERSGNVSSEIVSCHVAQFVKAAAQRCALRRGEVVGQTADRNCIAIPEIRFLPLSEQVHDEVGPSYNGDS